MRSTAKYSALPAIIIQFRVESNESMCSTASWEFENQLPVNAAHIYYMIHSDIKLVLDYGENEMRRAQNEINSDRVEEYAFQSIRSLDLDLPV